MAADGMRGDKAALPIAILMVAAFATAAPPPPNGGNLILNGNFATGSGESPDHWRGEAGVNSPSAYEYRWIPPAHGQPGELEVNNRVPNDVRWAQSLELAPGWYYISAEMRAENVPANKTGANITLFVRRIEIRSQDLHGTTDWQNVGFYVKIGSHETSAELWARVGGYPNLNLGTGFFRKVSVVPTAEPPAGATPVFDLEAEIRHARIGEPWTLGATFILLAIVAYLGWRMFGEATIREKDR